MLVNASVFELPPLENAVENTNEIALQLLPRLVASHHGIKNSIFQPTILRLRLRIVRFQLVAGVRNSDLYLLFSVGQGSVRRKVAERRLIGWAGLIQKP